MIGFLGAGAITSAIVTGLYSGEGFDHPAVVSPRNEAVAAALARQFPSVTVAASNQHVVDAAGTVIIAVRPQIVRDVLPALRFRQGQNIVSLVSGLPVARIAELVAPATSISRAVPLPSTARRLCPTPIYPRDPVAEQIFNLLGAAFAADTEHQFDVYCSATATMAAYFAFADGIAAWLAANGIAESDARAYVARILAGLADTAMRNPARTFPELAADHATRGGTNEQLLGHLQSNGVFQHLADALDGILRRVTAASVRQAVPPANK